LPCKAETILGMRFEWIFKPCAFVAGDIFNFFRLDENHVGFYILDVAGHGISAALLSVTLSRILSRNVQGECPFVKAVPGSGGCSLLSPSQVVADLNRSFLSDEDIMQYFTMVYGTADCRSGNVRMTQAGHPSPVVAGKNGSIYVPGKGGFPVGMLPDAEYDEIEFRLAPGDRLVLYSDGVTECLDRRGEMFSAERLFAILRKGRGESLDTVVGRIGDSLNEWKKEGAFDDDITLLAMEIA
jgi:phosphoserine phosphatase RsbU/P